jgi:hypothetical protein
LPGVFQFNAELSRTLTRPAPGPRPALARTLTPTLAQTLTPTLPRRGRGKRKRKADGRALPAIGSIFLNASKWLYNQPMKLRLAVLLWITGILFPLAWFSRMDPAAKSLFNSAFASGWTHVVMHAMLYAVLASGLSTILPSGPRRMPWRILAILLLVGLTQEALQFLPYHSLPNLDSAFDLLVDLSGGALGLIIYSFIRQLNLRTPRRLG